MRGLLLPCFALAILPVALASCASGGSRESSSLRDTITYEDVQDLSVSSAYEAIRRLRPRWLLSRGTGAGEVVVFLNERRLGPVSALEGIQTSSIVTMTFIDARDATIRFGSGHSGGIISVITRK